MSVIQFELNEKHVKLLKHLRWSLNDKKSIVGISGEEDSIPFGEDNLYEAIDIILNGKPVNFNPLETEEAPEYSAEQKAEWDELYVQLTIALEIILHNSTFELGTYRCRFHLRDWKKIN